MWFFQVRMSHVLRFISICNLYADPLSYVSHAPFNSFFLTDHLILCSDLLLPPYEGSDAVFSASCYRKVHTLQLLVSITTSSSNTGRHLVFRLRSVLMLAIRKSPRTFRSCMLRKRWDRGFESHSRSGCLPVSCLLVLSCVGSGLATGWYSDVGVLSTVCKVQNYRKLSQLIRIETWNVKNAVHSLVHTLKRHMTFMNADESLVCSDKTGDSFFKPALLCWNKYSFWDFYEWINVLSFYFFK
jgi:hypothetical protein